jgi:peptidoglycan hydrolase CwlO-like protein
VSIRSKFYLAFFFLAILIIVTGCFNQRTPIEKINDTFEKVVSAEKGFEEQQEPLISLEKNEKEIYVKIIGLGMKQFDEIVKLSNEAITMVDKRKEYMDKENESIEKSKKAFEKIAEFKKEIDDPDLKKQVDEIYSIMMDRYSVHDTLYKEYIKGANGDKKLYEMLKDKNLPLEDLEAKVNQLNETYQKIFNANKNFNNLTERYNDSKKEFYKKAEQNK